jgi:hypothetical protein
VPAERPAAPSVSGSAAAPAGEPLAEPGGPERASFASADLRVLLCRLSTYEQVLPSVTHRALLWAARGVPGVHADVAYRPPDDGRPRRGGAPPSGWVAPRCGEPARRLGLRGGAPPAPPAGGGAGRAGPLAAATAAPGAAAGARPTRRGCGRRTGGTRPLG